MSEVICGECGSAMVLRQSPKFKNPYFYGCSQYPNCTGTHTAHPDGSPCGIPANKETRGWRIKAHDAFDRVWKSQSLFKPVSERRKARSEAYKQLAIELQSEKDVHIAEADIEMCQKIIEASDRLFKSMEKK